METKIGGERVQARSGKLVTYKVTINRDGDAAAWSGEILLRAGRWYRLNGGALIGVDAATVSAAATQAFDSELEQLDLEELNKKYGN